MTLYCKNRTNHDPVCTNIRDKCIAHTTVLHSKSTQNGQESSRFMRTSWQALKPLTVLLLCSSMQNTILSFVWNATKNNMQHAWSAFPPENSNKFQHNDMFWGLTTLHLSKLMIKRLCVTKGAFTRHARPQHVHLAFGWAVWPGSDSGRLACGCKRRSDCLIWFALREQHGETVVSQQTQPQPIGFVCIWVLTNDIWLHMAYSGRVLCLAGGCVT